MMDRALIREIADILARPVVLTGMMGSGKSHAGRELAAALEVPFFDSDKLIEKKSGLVISEIFEQQGEAAFRTMEKDIIQNLLSNDVCVIATGGGALMDADTRRAVQEKSITVWLRADLATLLERAGRNKKRPLLACGNPEEVLQSLLGKREAVYMQSDIEVDSGGSSIDATVEALIRKLHAFVKE